MQSGVLVIKQFDFGSFYIFVVIFIHSGGYVYRTNFVRAGEVFIRDFRAGLLGKVNLDGDQLASINDSSKETKDNDTLTENNQEQLLDVGHSTDKLNGC